MCGSNNCDKIGGEWDSEDDCCERRCSAQHPCTHAEGHCEAPADCERSGYQLCDKKCISSAFPSSLFPNNTLSKYSASDSCCARRQVSLSQIVAIILVFSCLGTECGPGVAGCLGARECKTHSSLGVRTMNCQLNVESPLCVKHDECTQDFSRE